jgi:hypothetical protein
MRLCRLPLVLVVSCLACARAPLPVRVLSAEPSSAPVPSPTLETEAAPTRDAGPGARIGAPGGSGAGSRRVLPADAR